MYYTKNVTTCKITNTDAEQTSAAVAVSRQRRCVCDASLTTYKKVVDNEATHYGLTQYDYNEVKVKLEKQKHFLANSFLYDKISHTKIPLQQITISSNNNPNRYYAEIQNRINTLTQEAEERELYPVFMTLTLPSEFHQMKYDQRKGRLVPNKKFNGTSPKEGAKELTKLFAKLRHDRSMKELGKDERIYYRVNEPHKDGTPHAHILLYVPKSYVPKIVKAFKRLFNTRSNDIQTDIKDANAYIMKYINKTLPLSKQDNLSQKEKYLNAWYSKHRIIRFNSSRTLAPLQLYRLVHNRYTLKELTVLNNAKALQIFVLSEDRSKIMEIFDGDEMIYCKSENYHIQKAAS